MAKLTNPTGTDLFAHHVQLMVPAYGSVEITDEQAAHYLDGQVFTVSDVEGDVEPVNRNVPHENSVPVLTDEEEAAKLDAAREKDDESDGDAATRSTAKKGSANAEVNTAPAKETR